MALGSLNQHKSYSQRAGEEGRQGQEPPDPHVLQGQGSPQGSTGSSGRERQELCTLLMGSALYVCFPAGHILSRDAQLAVPAGFRSTVFYREFYLKHWLEFYNPGTLHSWVPSTEMSDFTGQEILQPHNKFHSSLKHCE